MVEWYDRTSDYAKYLRSPHWRVIKERIIERDKDKCRICGGIALEVHHHDYSPATMQGKNDAALVSLCRICHRAIEYDGHAKRYDLSEKRKAFDQRRRDHLKIVRAGLCLKAIVSTDGSWRRVVFKWDDAVLAEQFASMSEVMMALLWSKPPNLSWGAKFSHSRLTQKSGTKLYVEGTKKLAAVLRLLDSDLTGEIRYKPELLADPIPVLRRKLGRDPKLKCEKVVQKRMAKLTGGSRSYKIRIEARREWVR